MSYCRFSSMDFTCDIYAYKSVGDFWQIYVAANRAIGIESQPKVPEFPEADAPQPEVERWAKEAAEAMNNVISFLRTAERQDIALPLAGASIQCATLSEFRAKMAELRQLGYRFPDEVLDEIDDELRAGA